MPRSITGLALQIQVTLKLDPQFGPGARWKRVSEGGGRAYERDHGVRCAARKARRGSQR